MLNVTAGKSRFPLCGVTEKKPYPPPTQTNQRCWEPSTSGHIHTKLSGPGLISIQFTTSSRMQDPFLFSIDVLIMTLLRNEEDLKRRSDLGELDWVESTEYLDVLRHEKSGLLLWVIPKLLHLLVLEYTDVEVVPLLRRTASLRLSPQTRMKPLRNFEDIRL